MRFSILTLFPDQVRNFLSESITGRAIKQGLIELDTINIRDFAENDYGKIDDTLYGGMTGLLIQCEPVYQAWKSTFGKDGDRPYTVYVSPKGKVLDQNRVMDLSKKDHICIICGHYEGIDDRVISEICDEEISIGDYVLTGGEIASVVIVDSVSRMVEGVLPSEDAYTNESHMSGTLEAPQYTKPPVWHEKEVPEVLKSGPMANIEEYYRIASLVETWQKRPDMLDKLTISAEDWEKMLAFKKSL
ncbi:MAG: tRNA (guanosine(37)-N1)-methyltransferase TrmD [Clostridiales bacterium]|nr:tRNA (guanosine(37)-N1)-methyltransferase TrmD [Clostridiales bacterium]